MSNIHMIPWHSDLPQVQPGGCHRRRAVGCISLLPALSSLMEQTHGIRRQMSRDTANGLQTSLKRYRVSFYERLQDLIKLQQRKQLRLRHTFNQLIFSWMG